MKKLILVLPLFLLSCVTATTGMSVSDIPLEGKKVTTLGTEEVTLVWYAVDAGIIGFPLAEPPVEEARMKLLQNKNGNALVNLRWWSDKSIWLLISRHRFHLKADVVRAE